jgi:hypothetical protein
VLNEALCAADSKKHSESIFNSINLSEPPPKDDAIATLLFQLLQPPRIEGALHVQVTPGRRMVVTKLPYLHPEELAV